jgi:hypothetical protein
VVFSLPLVAVRARLAAAIGPWLWIWTLPRGRAKTQGPPFSGVASGQSRFDDAVHRASDPGTITLATAGGRTSRPWMVGSFSGTDTQMFAPEEAAEARKWLHFDSG